MCFRFTKYFTRHFRKVILGCEIFCKVILGYKIFRKVILGLRNFSQGDFRLQNFSQSLRIEIWNFRRVYEMCYVFQIFPLSENFYDFPPSHLKSIYNWSSKVKLNHNKIEWKQEILIKTCTKSIKFEINIKTNNIDKIENMDLIVFRQTKSI